MEAKTLQEQYQAIHKSAGWADLSYGEVLEFSGKDTVSFLNNYNTQDIQRLKSHQVALGAFLTQKGKIISDSIILKLPDKILVLLAPGFSEKVLQHLEVYLTFADTKIDKAGEKYGHLALLGPERKKILEAVGLPSKVAEDSIAQESLQGKDWLIFPTQRLGSPALEILGLRVGLPKLKKAIQEAGALPLESQVLEVIRVEKGYPKIGLDMGEGNLVAEVGLDQRATDFNKGCYLGQETTARVNTQGHVNKKLTLFVLEKSFQGDLPLEVHQGEKVVGKITSLVDSLKWKSPIALGIVQTKAIADQGSVNLETPAGKIGMKKLSL